MALYFISTRCSNYRRGAYLYRKDRTKRQRKLSDRVNDSLERQKGRRRVSTSASATSNSNGSATSACVDSDQDSVSQDEDENDGDHDEERVCFLVNFFIPALKPFML